ncbi:hypothetical protein M5K25_006653 [Dendrobium thyrsiflorum]|uniref:Uncharacterized protein n=1 Tax=Dendrobium thyrsiflorum TaxID=117978 RepID=A0ABD0VDD3_DENTH
MVYELFVHEPVGGVRKRRSSPALMNLHCLCLLSCSTESNMQGIEVFRLWMCSLSTGSLHFIVLHIFMPASKNFISRAISYVNRHPEAIPSPSLLVLVHQVLDI